MKLEESKEITKLKVQMKALNERQQTLEESVSRDNLDRWKIIKDLTDENNKLTRRIEELEGVTING